jgi:hypothetical protein
MKDDPIVAEVRRIRHEHAARFKYDLDLITKDLKTQEQASGRSHVRLPPRRLAVQQTGPSAATD